MGNTNILTKTLTISSTLRLRFSKEILQLLKGRTAEHRRLTKQLSVAIKNASKAAGGPVGIGDAGSIDVVKSVKNVAVYDAIRLVQIVTVVKTKQYDALASYFHMQNGTPLYFVPAARSLAIPVEVESGAGEDLYSLIDPHAVATMLLHNEHVQRIADDQPTHARTEWVLTWLDRIAQGITFGVAANIDPDPNALVDPTK